MLIFIVMTVVGNFYFSIFLRLMWEFLDLESERGSSVCWPNNKIIDRQRCYYKKYIQKNTNTSGKSKPNQLRSVKVAPTNSSKQTCQLVINTNNNRSFVFPCCVIPHGNEMCVQDLIPRVRYARQAPVAAVLRCVRRSSRLPVPRGVPVRPELRHVSDVQEPCLPSAGPDTFCRLRDHHVDP